MKTAETEVTETTTAPPARALTWIEQAFLDNPLAVLELDPNDPAQLIVDPANNSRGTPDVGDKSLLPLMTNIVRDGQQQPSLGTIDAATGAVVLRAGFRRARSLQTYNVGKAPEDQKLLRVMLMPGATNNLEAFERSVDENAFRTEPNLMEKAAALVFFMSDDGGSYTLKDAATRMNMSIGAASTYARFMLFPAITKKAAAAGKVPYGACERFVALLPSRDELLADEDGSKLKAAQDRIAEMTKKELEAGGKVNTSAVDKATRKVKGGKKKGGKEGAAANNRQRTAKGVISEIDEYVAQLEDPKVFAAKVLLAVKKFTGGGSLAGLVKVIEAGE